MNQQRNKFLPEVKTMGDQGYDLFTSSSRGFSFPAGTPKEIVDIMSAEGNGKGAVLGCRV